MYNPPVIASSLELYLTQINQFPLLSPAEEFELAVHFQDKKDIEAAHKLITSNLRFVVKVALEYRSYGVKLLDLIQEGNMGLMMAVKKFKAVFCGLVPPIFADGHIFFGKDTGADRHSYNAAIEETVNEFTIARPVTFEHLSRDHYEDPVHFNEKGNMAVAETFAGAVLDY